jgi:MFS family permease
MLVGLGVSTVVPGVYSLAGKTPGIEPSKALTAVSSVSFLGFLIGPPVIGYIAHAVGLKMSFALIGIFGVGIAFLVNRVKAIE